MIGIEPSVAHIVSGAREAAEREEKRMAQKCKIPGCDKLAQHGKDGMCCGHWREKTGTPPKKRGEPKTAAPASPAPGKRERSSLPVPTPAQKGRLLSRLSTSDRPGIFVDFTGHEDLLDQIGPVSPELNAEIITLLAAVMAGNLAWKEPLQ